MARVRTSRGSFPARRASSWEDGPGGTTIQSFSSTGSGFLGAGAQALRDGLTLVRLRGQAALYLSDVTSVLDGFVGAVGIGIFTAEAFAIGITAVPTPIADAKWDGWIYWKPFQLVSQTTTDTLLGEEVLGADKFEVDTKAMRKLREGDTVAMVMEVVERGTAVIKADFDSRMLLKLP